MGLELHERLVRIADILRSGEVMHPLTSIEQISYLIYLKLIDDEESARELEAINAGEDDTSISKLLFPRQSRRYRWSQWRSMEDRDMFVFLGGDVFPYMASLVKEDPQVAEYFRDAVLEISRPDILRMLVDEIEDIDFTGLGNDVKGTFFEQLITRVHMGSEDQLITPSDIRAMMAEMVDPDLGDRVYDPACGTGGFLASALNHVLAKYSCRAGGISVYGEKTVDREILERNFFGADISRLMTRIARMNLILHGIQRPEINRADIFSEIDGLNDTDPVGEYDVILSNPPFPGGLPSGRVSKKNEPLFLKMVIKLLAVGGRCAVIVPDVLLSGRQSSYRELRRDLVEKYDMLAVISLPRGALISHSNVKTSVLVFRKPEDSTRKDKIWFYDVQYAGFVSEKIPGGNYTEETGKNDIPDILSKWNDYKKSDYSIPPGIQSGVLLDSESEEPRCWWTTVETIAENDYDLDAMWYKPRVACKAPDDDPADLIREVLAIGDEISEGMKKLLRDLEAAE